MSGMSRRRVQNAINGGKGAKASRSSSKTREDLIRKIADMTILTQGRWEEYIEKLRSIGLCIVPIDPTDAMCNATRDELKARDILRAAIAEGAL